MRFAERPGWVGWTDSLVGSAKRTLGLQTHRVVGFTGIKFGENEFKDDDPVFVTVTSVSLADYRHFAPENPVLEGKDKYGGTARATGCDGAFSVSPVIVRQGEQSVIAELLVYPLDCNYHRIGLVPLPKDVQDAFMVTFNGDLMLRP